MSISIFIVWLKSMSAYFGNQINYSLGDEDTNLEYNVLQKNAKKIMVIAGSGGRVIPLLAKHPTELVCVDISQAQLYLTELRISAMRQLHYDDFLRFLGYSSGCNVHERKQILRKLKFSKEAKTYISNLLDSNAWSPIIYMGRFERMLILFSRIITKITQGKLRSLFQCETLNEQISFFRSKYFPRKRWQLIIAILSNAAILNSLLYKGNFPKKNISKPYSAIYGEMFENLFSTIHAKESFFLQLLLLGEIKFIEGGLLETNKEIFLEAKNSIETRVKFVQGNILQIIKSCQGGIDYLSLSDVPSFLLDNEAKSFLKIFSPHLIAGAQLIYRGHLKIIKPNCEDYEDITSKYNALFLQEKTQLWTTTILKKKE